MGIFCIKQFYMTFGCWLKFGRCDTLSRNKESYRKYEYLPIHSVVSVRRIRHNHFELKDFFIYIYIQHDKIKT